MWYYESLKVMNDEVLKSRSDGLKVGSKFRKNENFLLALSFWHGREAETLCSQTQGYISITKSIMLKVQMFRLPPQTLGWVFGTHILKPFRWGSRRSSVTTWKQTNLGKQCQLRTKFESEKANGGCVSWSSNILCWGM